MSIKIGLSKARSRKEDPLDAYDPFEYVPRRDPALFVHKTSRLSIESNKIIHRYEGSNGIPVYVIRVASSFKASLTRLEASLQSSPTLELPLPHSKVLVSTSTSRSASPTPYAIPVGDKQDELTHVPLRNIYHYVTRSHLETFEHNLFHHPEKDPQQGLLLALQNKQTFNGPTNGRKPRGRPRKIGPTAGIASQLDGTDGTGTNSGQMSPSSGQAVQVVIQPKRRGSPPKFKLFVSTEESPLDSSDGADELNFAGGRAGSSIQQRLNTGIPAIRSSDTAIASSCSSNRRSEVAEISLSALVKAQSSPRTSKGSSPRASKRCNCSNTPTSNMDQFQPGRKRRRSGDHWQTQSKHIAGTASKKDHRVKDDQEYEIEAIISDEYASGQRSYLVKWVGWDIAHASWLPESDLLGGADEILDEYKATKRAVLEGVLGINEEGVRIVDRRMQDDERRGLDG